MGFTQFEVPIGYCVKTCELMNQGALTQGRGNGSGKDCGLSECLTRSNNFSGMPALNPSQQWLTCKGEALFLVLAAPSAILRMKTSCTPYGATPV